MDWGMCLGEVGGRLRMKWMEGCFGVRLEGGGGVHGVQRGVFEIDYIDSRRETTQEGGGDDKGLM